MSMRLPISSDAVCTCRGDRKKIEELMMKVSGWIYEWVERYSKIGVDSAVVQNRFDDSIAIDTVNQSLTIVRLSRSGSAIKVSDVLGMAEKSPNPAAALCTYFRVRINQICREERMKSRRGGKQWEGEEPHPASESNFTAQDREQLARAMEQLSEEEVIALKMYFVEDLSERAIAARTKSSKSTVNRQVKRGIANLRSSFAVA